MSVVRTVEQIEYPESDGRPMGETDLHRDWMVRILEILRQRYRGQRVYIASDLLVYYQEGDPKKFVVPDDFVVQDCDPGRRRTYKIWEEGKPPEVVFEVTSRATRRKDQTWKPQIYSQIGVQEYFLYDPTADYLKPPLRGFRLVERAYQPIEPNANGEFLCQALNITLRVEAGELVFRDGATGEVLRTRAEAAEAASEIDRAARKASDAARKASDVERQAAEQRAAELEAELQRLREELQRKSR